MRSPGRLPDVVAEAIEEAEPVQGPQVRGGRLGVGWIELQGSLGVRQPRLDRRQVKGERPRAGP